MKHVTNGCLIGVALLFLLVVGCVAKGMFVPRQVRSVFEDPMPSGAINPMWLAPGHCRKANAKDIRHQNGAMRTLEDFPDAPRHLLADTALWIVTQPWASVQGVANDPKHPKEGWGLLCPPEHLVDRIAAATQRNEIFIRAGKLDQTGLQAARAIGPRNPYIIRAVARTAFADHVVPDRADITDLRPYARLILAEFGGGGPLWVKRASLELNDDSELGIGAAQIVAATGEPAALKQIEKMMNDRLAKLQADEIIQWHERNRLYGLAIALGMNGAKAQPYTSGIIELMNRRVNPGGVAPKWIGVNTRRMCWVADRIGGRLAQIADNRPYCHDRYTVTEQ